MRRKIAADLEHDSADSAPAWMVSYGDMMSLLLTLFVMLVSMSEIKQNDRFQGVADSLHEQFSLNLPDAAGRDDGIQSRNAALAVLAVAGRQTRQKVMADGARHRIVSGPPAPVPAVIIAPADTPEKSMVRVSLSDEDAVSEPPPAAGATEPSPQNPDP